MRPCCGARRSWAAILLVERELRLRADRRLPARLLCRLRLREERRHLGRPGGNIGPERATTRRAGLLDVLERNGAIRMFRADRPAEEPVAMEHADLSYVARVVTDGDGLPNINSERGVHVAQALEMDAVATNTPGGGDVYQQEIKRLEAVGHPRHPAVGNPGVPGGGTDLAVNA